MTNPLPGLMDGINRSIERKGACPICESSVHPDGSISHDEDCGVPGAIAFSTVATRQSLSRVSPSRPVGRVSTIARDMSDAVRCAGKCWSIGEPACWELGIADWMCADCKAGVAND